MFPIWHPRVVGYRIIRSFPKLDEFDDAACRSIVKFLKTQDGKLRRWPSYAALVVFWGWMIGFFKTIDQLSALGVWNYCGWIRSLG